MLPISRRRKWVVGGRWSPDYEINRDGDRMVVRVRDLIGNDGWGTGAVNRILDNTVGAQFLLASKPDYMALRAVLPKFDATWAAEFAAVVDAGWRMFADDPAHHCDASRMQTMTQMFYYISPCATRSSTAMRSGCCSTCRNWSVRLGHATQ